jgi:glucose-1-phosphate thymidylyltransferase
LKVIIPVAGFGTRMRPHTHTRPKPLISVAGNTSVGFILNELEKMDVSEVIFITGHLKEKFEDYIKSNFNFKARFIEQKTVNGTAGAINLAREFIDEPVLIVFVDTVFDADLSIIKKLKPDESGIIWTKEVEDYKRFGVCVMHNGYLSKIVEKPSEPVSKLANIGVYYVKDYKLLFEGIEHVFKNNITLKGEYFLTDAFSYMISKGAKFICPEVKGWYDLGAKETALESNRLLLEKHKTLHVDAINSSIIQPVFVGKNVKIENSVIGPFATIEDGCEIKNSIIKDSIVCKSAKVDNMLVESSIIGQNVELKGNFRKLNLGDHTQAEF